ncbi:MAG: L,D-transpeptidase YcbB [Ramlibacter sp.]|jgi:murein L,D-transpeptidase YcbB/YkuD|nr:L,D-transpeptidase YcbB [Ramlibacter sp.]
MIRIKSAPRFLIDHFVMAMKYFRLLLLALAIAAGPSARAEALLWFSSGRPTAQAHAAVEVLSLAAGQGLQPRDYDTDPISRRLAQASNGAPLDEPAQAALDDALTRALQRYLSDLQIGRVEPRRIHANFDVRRADPLDAATYLRTAVTQQRLAQALHEAEPRVPMYAALRRVLARYRELEGHPAWEAPLPPIPGRKLAPGQPWAGLPLLVRRLEALGDFPAGTAVPARLDGTLVTALRSFQERHGLTPDGVLGRSTLQQLGVTPAARTRQIELTLERLRWTPLLQGPRMIVVNVPEFVLRAYEVHDGKVDVQVTMKVIVGKAMDTRTPLFDEDMRYIEFSPYWNVPPSIARNETVPRLRREPAYFSRQGFEFVTPAGEVVTTLSGSHLDAVLRAGWRIRQRPGPDNALGGIKFVFPNRDNIYLHHTPAPTLFARDRRDFSHGCIRVEEPIALARFVLQGEPEWTEQRIRDAMDKGESNVLRLSRPLPVLIAYSTVIVKGGRVFFYPDLYGHDRLLDQALRQR